MKQTNKSIQTAFMITIVLMVAALLPKSAYAEGPGWTAFSTVKKLVNTTGGGVNVELSPGLTNCVSQSGYGPTYASIRPSHAAINRMKADLLVAFVTGKRVALYLFDNQCNVEEMILAD